MGKINIRGLGRELSVGTLGIGVALAESLKSNNSLLKRKRGKKVSENESFTVVLPFPSPRVE